MNIRSYIRGNNMKKVNLKIILFLVFCISLSLLAKPREETLIKTWEAIQKSDPKTVIFEKLEENTYKFKTERFPFDGILKVLNVSIEDRMSDSEYGYIMGVVEIELVDSPRDFMEKYSYSYSMWAQNNMLYYDKETEKWLSNKDYYAKSQERLPKPPRMFFWNILSYGPIVILIVFVVFSLIVINNLQKKNRKYMDFAEDSTKKSLELIQKSLVLGEESNRVLKEILEELKK